MKLKSYLFIGLAALALASCDDDFGDWVVNPNNQQGEIASFGNGSVAPVSTIDFRSLGDDVQSVQVCSITAPTSNDTTYANTYQLKLGDETFSLTSDGNVSRSDLETYVNNLWGKRPVERTTKAVVIAYPGNGLTTTRITSDTFDIKTIAKAPEIEQVYYLVGNVNGWNHNVKNETYKVTNGGGDVYDDPVFTIVIDAPAGSTDAIEFKLCPESQMGTDDWTKSVTAATDGTEGKLTDGNAGGNLSIPYDANAKKYRITFNLLDQTWSYKALNFNEYIYLRGGGDWGTDRPLYGPNFDGKYYGYYYLSDNFKFKPLAGDDWNGDFGQDPNGATGKLVDDGEQDCPLAEADYGFYRIDVDMAAMTYSLTKISSIGIIGSAVNGDTSWGTEYDMTYNAATGNWEWTGALTAGEFKFRSNHAWDPNPSWGGTSGGTDYDHLTQNNGQNLTIAEAGTYKITLTVHHENGQCKAVIEKQ